tara:strand:- start:631 stop:1572 length:942 start_codon:yes stop_codon:yes gene_type:complete
MVKTDDKIFFSVGIMAYNNAQYISKAISSVLNQTFDNWELIISDDNSSDNTEQIVRPYLNDSRIKYKKHSVNLGQADNWKYVISNSRGVYFATLHADDFWDWNYLRTAYHHIKKDSYEIIQYNWVKIDESNNNIGTGPLKIHKVLSNLEFLRIQLERFTCLPSATIFKRDLAKVIDYPDSKYKFAVDLQFFIKLAIHIRLAVQIDENLVYYRIHNNSATSNFGSGENWRKERKILRKDLEHYFKNENVKSAFLRLLKSKEAQWAFESALINAKIGNKIECKLDMKEGMGLTTIPNFKNFKLFMKVFYYLKQIK